MNDNMIFRSPSRGEVTALMAEADRLRAEAFSRILRSAGNGILAAARKLGSGVAQLLEALHEGVEARARYEELSRMSDRQLAALGITRGDIPRVVVGVYTAPVAANVAAPAQAEAAPEAETIEEIRKAA